MKKRQDLSQLVSNPIKVLRTSQDTEVEKATLYSQASRTTSSTRTASGRRKLRTIKVGQGPGALTVVTQVDLSQEEKDASVQSALADPEDPRSDEELAVAFGLDVSYIKKRKEDKSFMGPVLRKFSDRLSSFQLDVFKTMLRRAKGGDVKHAELFLKSTGVLKNETNNTFFIHSGEGGQSQKDLYSTMSDEILDEELNRMFLDTFPPDVAYESGKVRSASYLQSRDGTTPRVESDTFASFTEGEDDTASPGTDEEDIGQ